jgi:glycosyltransferase involved in cell wall biosynthesis
MFDSSLRTDGQRRLAQLGEADLLIGIPTYKNAATIAQVMTSSAKGAQMYFPTLRTALAVVDGGSADETVTIASTVMLPPAIRRIVTTYQGLQGKGSAVRAIFEIARAIRARVCIVLEADLITVTPEWIPKLAMPILSGEYEYVIPAYVRPLVESAINDLLAYPLTRLLYNVDVRQPMAGDWAVSGKMADRLYARDVWETDVARHGIDVWITTLAVNENIPMCQAPLGPKIERKREAAVAFDPGFVQVVGTLFRMLEIYRKRWIETRPLRIVPVCGEQVILKEQRLSGDLTVEKLTEAFHSGTRRYRRFWRTILVPTNFDAVIELCNKSRGATHFSATLWARVVFDFAVVYNQGESDPDKVAAALLPLYYARLATLLRETNAKIEAVEQAIQAQARVFEEQRPYLIYRWQNYVPWELGGVR